MRAMSTRLHRAASHGHSKQDCASEPVPVPSDRGGRGSGEPRRRRGACEVRQGRRRDGRLAARSSRTAREGHTRTLTHDAPRRARASVVRRRTGLALANDDGLISLMGVDHRLNDRPTDKGARTLIVYDYSRSPRLHTPDSLARFVAHTHAPTHHG